MITARKHRMAELLLDRYNRYLLRRHFHALHYRGARHGEGLDRTRPMVFYGNHSSWWDGLVTYMLSREHLALDGYWMMEERQLARYGFFRRTGRVYDFRHRASGG